MKPELNLSGIAKLAWAALLSMAFACSAASAQTFSLSGNWSNTPNPNSPWTYRQGTTRLAVIPNWDTADLPGCNQTAWAPSNSASNLLPGIFRANTCSTVALDILSNYDYNVLAGDVVVHTVDPFKGNPSAGVANVLFTLPYGDDGNYQISGSLWDASLYYHTSRPQDWVLLVNGVQKASGSLSGEVVRPEAQTFSVFAALAGGDTVELDVMKDPASADGEFVGTAMTIKPGTPPPPPPSKCALTDKLAYNAATGSLTMAFTVATPTAATWRIWLAGPNGLQTLLTQALPKTEPAVAKTRTQAVPKSGQVGILSTLTTPTGGITCSSWLTVNTGTP